MQRKLTFALVVLNASCGLALGDYGVKEDSTGVTLTTPFGEKRVVDVERLNNVDNYKIAIPLKDLKPDEKPKVETAAPKPAEEPTKVAIPETKPDAAKEKREPASQTPAIAAAPIAPTEKETKPAVVEIDDSDQMIVEANWLYNHRRYFEALTVVERVLRKKPDALRAWIMKGSLLYVQGEKEMAKTAWQKAQTLDPQNSEVQTLLEHYQ